MINNPGGRKNTSESETADATVVEVKETVAGEVELRNDAADTVIVAVSGFQSYKTFFVRH
jgi:hypothetical protein